MKGKISISYMMAVILAVAAVALITAATTNAFNSILEGFTGSVSYPENSIQYVPTAAVLFDDSKH